MEPEGIREQLLWLAGWLEGEGHFYNPKKTTRTLRIAAQTVDKEPLDRMAAIVGTKVFGPYGPYKGNRQPFFAIHLGGAKAAGWMMMLYPFMSVRRQSQIKRAITEWKALGTLTRSQKSGRYQSSTI